MKDRLVVDDRSEGEMRSERTKKRNKALKPTIVDINGNPMTVGHYNYNYRPDRDDYVAYREWKIGITLEEEKGPEK